MNLQVLQQLLDFFQSKRDNYSQKYSMWTYSKRTRIVWLSMTYLMHVG